MTREELLSKSTFFDCNDSETLSHCTIEDAAEYYIALLITTAFAISACFLPPKPSDQDFCENQPASVDTILAAQERGVMTKVEVETFFDLLWLVQVKCDEADKAGISEVKVELEILARKVKDRR